MAYYSFEITIPANTPETTPTVKEIEIEGEILHEIAITVPTGHAGLARLAIFYGIEQLWPTNKGAWFRGDGMEIEWREYWELPNKITKLILKGWNEDEVYEHTFIVKIGVLPKFYVFPEYVVLEFVTLLKTLLGLE